MKTFVCRNYKIYYEKRKDPFNGREYISGNAEYIGKEYRLTNTFYTSTCSGRLVGVYDSIAIPKYLEDKVIFLHEKECK